MPQRVGFVVLLLLLVGSCGISSSPSLQLKQGSSHSQEATPSAAPTSPVTIYGTTSHPFAASSVWNTPIPPSPKIDPQSAAISAAVLTNPSLVVNVDLYNLGVPMYTATPSTPRVAIAGMATGTGLVPLDPSWTPNANSDHKIVIYDPATTTVYELWAFNPATRTTGWGVKHNYATEMGDGYAPPDQYHQSPTGAGVSQAAGVIRVSDIQSGVINHALAFSTSSPAASLFRYPASKTDGASYSANALIEGMRVQLDPNLDVDAIPGMTPGEKMIAKALQKYGAFCMDNGQGNDQAMGFYAELPTTGMQDPYAAAGLVGDWAVLPHIPRNDLYVLDASVSPRP